MAWKTLHFQEDEMRLKSKAKKRKIAEQKIIEMSTYEGEKVKCTAKVTENMQVNQNNPRESEEENHAEKQVALRKSLKTKNEEIKVSQNFIILKQQKTNNLQIMLHEEIEKTIDLTEEIKKLEKRLDNEIKKRVDAKMETKKFRDLRETEVRDLKNKALQCQLKLKYSKCKISFLKRKNKQWPKSKIISITFR